jgi:hypothetical protein
VTTKEVERATIAFSKEPQTVKEALKGEDAKKWEIAMQEEYDFLLSITFGPWCLSQP